MNSTAYEKDTISSKLKKAIEKKEQLCIEHKFFIALPDPSDHRNHLSGEVHISSILVHYSPFKYRVIIQVAGLHLL